MHVIKKPKFETRPGDKVVSDEVALQDRLDLKEKSPEATLGSFVNFFMSHDGTPPQNFIIKVKNTPLEMDLFVANLEGLLQDPSYAEDFFSATGTVLNVYPFYTKPLAGIIAAAVLEQSPTLQ
ncbi:MAG: hypothetical protein NTW35_02170 [Candidatus Nomurabacteria bacterium]|nr:hypothetical protein [Candidatus Nomurabacteria bacterium]